MKLVTLEPAPVVVGAAALVPPPDGGPIDVPAASGEPAVRFRRMDRYGALGFAATRLALRDAKLAGSGRGDPDWATLFGSSSGCGASNAEYFRLLGAGTPPEIGPALFARTVCNTVNGEVAIAEQLGGESETIVSGWAAGAEALAEASAWIAGGRVRFAVAGGIEAPGPDQHAIHAAFREEEGNGWLPPWLEEAAAICVLAREGSGPRVRAYARGFDPSGDVSLAATLEALGDIEVSHVLVANRVPPPLRRRLEADAAGLEVVDVSGSTGELGAAGGALAASLVREVVPSGRAGLVIARGIEGSTVILVVSR